MNTENDTMNSLEEIRRLNNELDMPLSDAEGAKVENGERRSLITARRALAPMRALNRIGRVTEDPSLDDPETIHETARRLVDGMNLTRFESPEAVRLMTGLVTKGRAWADDHAFAWEAIDEVCKANKKAFEDLKAASDIVGAENFRDTLSDYVSLIDTPALTEDEVHAIRMGLLRLRGRRLRLAPPEDDVPPQ